MNKQLIRELGLESAYDFNVWSQEDGSITLTAYELSFVGAYGPSNIQTNSSRYHSITFTAPEDIKEIEYLLDDLYVNHYPLTDYDDWVALDFITRDKAPARIARFIIDLPEYTPVVHEYDREEESWKQRLLEV
jgi:hypothetical protein